MATADTLSPLAPGFRFRIGRIGRGGKAAPCPPAVPRLHPEAMDFQDDLEQLIGEPPPPMLGQVQYLIALLFALLVLGAALVEVDVVVTGSGRIATDTPPVVLQPMERAVILELLVKPGDSVVAGQVVAVLDATEQQADTESLSAQQRALAAQWQRVQAELDGTAYPLTADAPLERRLQATLFAQRQALLATRMRGLGEDIAGLEANIRAIVEGAGFQTQQAAIARDVEGMRSQLLVGQIGSRLQYLGARQARLQAEHELNQTNGRLRELRHSLQARQAERQALQDDWRRQLLEESIRVRADHVRVTGELTKLARRSELMLLKAPQDGVVLEVARRAVGSVVREAEPLVTLVPSRVPLIAQIAVLSADIGYARPGDAVVLKVDAFPYQRHGTLEGRLRSFSQESFGVQAASEADGLASARAGGGALHRGYVELPSLALSNLPRGARLTPGMTLTAEIKVGTRSVLSYFLYPLARGLHESMREP